jgi:diguanylate cyclase (GGDEF)-like protein
MLLSPGAERRSSIDRRSGVDRRAGAERGAVPQREAESRHLPSREVWLGTATEPAARHPEPVPLGRLLPHGRFNEREAAERTAAIAAHQDELSARLGRNVGLSVAALDYLFNISGDLVAPTIVEHEILEVLEHRSVTDPLTGLYNRYHFEATLKREVARCLRYQSGLSLLLMDVDQLKAVNDRWGHQAGDQMLVRVAGAIRDSLRGSDIASRYGGDEFAVILPDTDTRAARLVAERMCDKVGASDASIKVTVSGGVADLSLAATGPAEARLIAAADRALYLAKGRGGNCVAEEVLPCRD